MTGQYPTRHAVYNVGGLMAVSPPVRKSAPIAPPRVNRKDIRPRAVTRAETLGKADSVAGTTLVVFLSDNGGLTHKTSNAPLRGGKGTFLEGGLRVPMIARQPGVVAAGSQSDEPVHVVDLYPTFMELAGAPAPAAASHSLDGTSLLPLVRGEAPNLSRPALFWHFPGYRRKSLEPSSVINRRHAGKQYKLT